MPNYNFSKFLPEAIDSALKQSYTNFEFIIIDNCSTDNSVEIIERFAKKDSRIFFKINKYNIGLVENLNLCLTYAKGDYVKFLFSDDTLISDKAVGKMVSVLDAYENVSLVATSRNMIDEQSNIIKILIEYHGKIGYLGTEIIKDCLIEQKNKIGEPSAVMFRKKHAIRGFDDRYRQIVDLEMWFHILEQGNFAYIEEPLCSFRVHPLQQTKVNAAGNVALDDSFLLIRDYANKPYNTMSRLKKEHMLYIPAYSTWKLYKKHGKISRQVAIERIRKNYDIYKFFMFYPLYKLYKLLCPLYKLNKLYKDR